MGSPDWNVSMVDIHLRKLWVYCPGQVACFSEDLKCWEAWDSTCGHKAKDITPSIAWRREALKEETLDDLPWKDERGPSSIRRTLEPFQRQRWGNFWETGWSAYGLFRALRYHLELDWTEHRTFGETAAVSRSINYAATKQRLSTRLSTPLPWLFQHAVIRLGRMARLHPIP